MRRRTFLQTGLGACLATRLWAAVQHDKLETAAQVLANAADDGQVAAAALYVQQGEQAFVRSFGASTSPDDIFLLASISKPISAAAVMTLYDRGTLRLDDLAQKFIPELKEGSKSRITLRHLLTHVSGLPDQLPQNQTLRQRHAGLAEFVAAAIDTPLLFEPGSQYSYSSMGILLAAEVAQRITGQDFRSFTHERVFRPLAMQRSAMGLAPFKLEGTMRCQVDRAAPESGAGDPAARDWDWNSLYWRQLGAPWGGAHASARDVARFLAEFLQPTGQLLKVETTRLMLRNHNPAGLRPRGLGFALGPQATSPACSQETFGHGGATGTLAWADPATQTVCVVLTTLPSQAANPHPRQLSSDRVAEAVAQG